MTSHPDVEALAFFAEELLEPDEERTVAAHIDTCATCATTLGELAGVSEALAAAPVPALPRDVADLLDQRVAEAVRERAAVLPVDAVAAEGAAPPPTGGGPASDGATVTPLPRRPRTGRSLSRARLMMLAAAAAVVVGGGGAALFNGVLTPGGRDGETGVAAPLAENGQENAPDTAQSYTPQVVRSETVYTEAALTEQAARTLDLSPVGGPGAGGGGEPGGGAETGPLAVEAAPPGLQECVVLLSDEFGGHFTLVDDAHYGGGDSPAWVLFSPRGERFEVYVVDPACARGGDPGQNVLAQETVQAP
ncbi:hypothetical protein [Nocardiopsis sp. HUAS JQ3]|uniref:hypothetical protein n=1 Tax=Nocardiopsis sp. HUAS JQ3 TaxID=3061629 RepID=UPI0023AA0362|nr:hypothetical protein [Nocardiopsis sp. HUAS JQ3]WDZ90997.1 hypothetical protein PV789_29705 [Nocardiopsis sp. HUAS JQ3]